MAALTFEEQNSLLTGTVKPVNVDIRSYIYIASKEYALIFKSTHKTFATVDQNNDPINQLASRYLSSMLSLSGQILKSRLISQRPVTDIMFESVVGYLGIVNTIKIGGQDIDFTLNQILEASAEQWEGFLVDLMPRLFEILADIDNSQKAEYDSL